MEPFSAFRKHVSHLICGVILLVSPNCFGDDLFASRSADWIEKKRSEALQFYDAKKYGEAEKGFYQMIAADPGAHSATYAVGYLQKIATESGTVKQAIEHYDFLKKAGSIPEIPEWPPGAGLIKPITEPHALVANLLSLLKLGGILAARTSILSVVLDGMGLSGPASFYVHETEVIVGRVQKEAYEERREALSLRPLQTMEPEFYERRFHLLLEDVAQAQILTFEKSDQEYGGIQLNRSLDGWHPHFRFNFQRQYDSNVAGVVDEAHLPSPHSRLGSQSNWIRLTFGAQGNLQNNPSFGWDYTLFVRSYQLEDFYNYNTVTHLGSLWLSFWNEQNNEVRLRLDGAFAGHQADVKEINSRTYGPAISLAHLWREKYRVDLGYSFYLHRDALLPATESANRDGTEHTLSVRVAYPSSDGGHANRNQPFFRYALGRDLTHGSEFDQIAHSFQVGTCYLIGTRSAFKFTTGLSELVYPRWGSERVDILKSLNGDLVVPFLFQSLSFTLNLGYETQTSPVEAFSWFKGAVGLSSQLFL